MGNETTSQEDVQLVKPNISGEVVVHECSIEDEDNYAIEEAKMHCLQDEQPKHDHNSLVNLEPFLIYKEACFIHKRDTATKHDEEIPADVESSQSYEPSSSSQERNEYPRLYVDKDLQIPLDAWGYSTLTTEQICSLRRRHRMNMNVQHSPDRNRNPSVDACEGPNRHPDESMQNRVIEDSKSRQDSGDTDDLKCNRSRTGGAYKVLKYDGVGLRFLALQRHSPSSDSMSWKSNDSLTATDDEPTAAEDYPTVMGDDSDKKDSGREDENDQKPDFDSTHLEDCEEATVRVDKRGDS